jgi:PadR family transcriptional regulator, regulatory protein PadR
MRSKVSTGEIMKGHVDLLLLAALEAGPAHGYAILDAVRERSGGTFDLAEGTVYPALYRLERRGFLDSGWVEASGTRRRRVYRLTRKGSAELDRQRTVWSGYVTAMRAALT